MKPLRKQKLQVGLFGLGCVGQGLYDLLDQPDSPFEIQQIVVKNLNKKRAVPSTLLNYDKASILANSEIDIIVEAIDDAGEALQLARASLRLGIPFVSASKKMVAQNMAELIELQQTTGTPMYYEAAVCGEVPILDHLNTRSTKRSLTQVRGIYNGTSNYILTQMGLRGLEYDQALQEAQELGFAETDPTSDVDGWDSLFKASIIATHVSGLVQHIPNLLTWSIKSISKDDIEFAEREGKQVKLIAQSLFDNDRVQTHVLPALVDRGDTAFGVNNEWNTVELCDGHHLEVLTGRGAGAEATAKAIYSDLLALGKGGRGYSFVGLESNDLLSAEPAKSSPTVAPSVDVLIRCKADILTPLLPGLKLYTLDIEGDEATFKGAIGIDALARQKDYFEENRASVFLLPDYKSNTSKIKARPVVKKVVAKTREPLTK